MAYGGGPPRIANIYVKTLTSSWAQLLTKAQCSAIRGVKLKVRVTPGQAPGFFDAAFSSSPDETSDVTDGTGYLSYSGAGFGDVLSPSNGIWVRTRSSGTVVIEAILYG